jgi:death-on-curing family protein
LPKSKPPACALGAVYVERIHDVLVSTLWPGADPIAEGEYRSIELIESAVARPFHSAFGQDAYPTIIDKAAELFHSLISNHPFYNANKRTAVIAFDHFLMANGYFLLLSNSEMYKLAEKTASYRERELSHEQSLAEIMQAVRDHIVSFQDFKQAKDEHPELAEDYIMFMEIRQMIRRSKLNRLLDPD